MNDNGDLLVGINHVATVTADLDRTIEFYGDVFGLEVIHQGEMDAGRHALLRIGKDSFLHAFEVPDSPHVVVDAEMFERGHIDHFALTAADADAYARVHERLVARGVAERTENDYGVARSVYFVDPDGMSCEVILIVATDIAEARPPRVVATVP